MLAAVTMHGRPLALIPLLAALSCAGAQARPCTDADVAPVRKFYEAMSGELINSGACDRYMRLAECPSYQALELHFELAARGVCQQVTKGPAQ